MASQVTKYHVIYLLTHTVFESKHNLGHHKGKLNVCNFTTVLASICTFKIIQTKGL